MKKQFFQFISLFLIVVTLAGCGGKAKESPAPGTELAVFYQAVLDMQPADAEELILFEEYNPDLMRIVALINKIADMGALERYFRPEGKLKDGVCALPVLQSPYLHFHQQ